MSEDKEKFFRSVAGKLGGPKFAEGLRDEFAEPLPGLDLIRGEDAEAPGFTRRDFLKLMGFSLGAVSAACSRMPVKKAVPYLTKPEEITPGQALWYASACAGCSAACGILVKTRDGRPIKIEGSPESPLNRGGLCATGQAQVLSLYDSGRLHGPLIKGREATWDEVDRVVKVALESTSGAVRVLSGSIVSPSTREAIARFVAAYPGAKHVEYDAVSYAGILDAHESTFGARVLPHFRFDRAQLIVSVAADFLGTWISPVEFTKGYAAARSPDKGGKKMACHVQFESVLSLTGANADTRVPIRPSEEGPIALHLLDQVLALAGKPRLAGLPEIDSTSVAEAIASAARELAGAMGKSIVACGSNDAAVQTVIAALNEELGNYGTTLDISAPSFQKSGSDRLMDELIGEMERGEVGALIVYGANPAYDWCDAERFANALKKVQFSVSLAHYADETASLATAVCPDHHPLESWGDARPVAGLYHIVQPTIRPVFNTRAAQESLLKWGGISGTYADFLKSWWEKNIFPRQSRFLAFDAFWNQCVHDGVFAEAEPFARVDEFAGDLKAAVTDVIKSGAEPSRDGGLELKLFESVMLRDGAHANNAWLQEVPDPVGKVTWGNCVSLSPAFAAGQGIMDGDILRLKAGKKFLELPAQVQPGQAGGSIGVALGYGRSAAGKVGNGVGANAFGFLAYENGTRRDFAAVTIEKTGRHDELATTQEHGSMEGRDIVQEVSLMGLLAGKKAKDFPHPGGEMLWKQHDKIGHAWGMAIDLNACIGCSGCLVGCQAENNVPVVGKDEVRRRREMHWIRVDRYYKGDEANPDTVFQPMMCQHCANAPCESVCPVAATVHSADGLNQQVYNRCVGTRYCANNCPYKVRRFNWFDYANNPRFDYDMNDELGKLVLNPDIVVRSRGVMEKCSLCVQRIQEGKLKAKLEGREVRDGDVKTACQQSCPADAIVFGDLKDPDSRISKLLKDNPRKYHVLGELNVQPAVAYMNKVRNRLGKI